MPARLAAESLGAIRALANLMSCAYGAQVGRVLGGPPQVGRASLKVCRW